MLLGLSCSFNGSKSLAGTLEFPELRKYTQNDRLHNFHGIDQTYGTKSLNGKREIVLTFDDGPSLETTPAILDTLKSYGVKATFFLVGKNITAKTEPLIARMLQEGHLIGNHSWQHDDSRKLSKKQFEDQFVRTELLVKNLQTKYAPSQDETYFRFPFGAYGYQQAYHHLNSIRDIAEALFGNNCINFVFWNMDSADYVSGMSAENIVQNVKSYFDGGDAFTYAWKHFPDGRKKLTKVPYQNENPPGGGVVLMHDIQPETVKALPKILDWANQNGIKIVPLNTLPEYSFEGVSCHLKQ